MKQIARSAGATDLLRISNVDLQQGHEEQAAEETLRAEALFGSTSERIAVLRSAYQVGGLTGLLRKRIAVKLEASGHQFNAYNLAIDYAALGEKDEAIQWLERAYWSRDSKLTVIAIEPIFDPLRSDPRFKNLSRQIRLPHSRFLD